jgi:hypothetical protein
VRPSGILSSPVASNRVFFVQFPLSFPANPRRMPPSSRQARSVRTACSKSDAVGGEVKADTAEFQARSLSRTAGVRGRLGRCSSGMSSYRCLAHTKQAGRVSDSANGCTLSGLSRVGLKEVEASQSLIKNAEWCVNPAVRASVQNTCIYFPARAVPNRLLRHTLSRPYRGLLASDRESVVSYR